MNVAKIEKYVLLTLAVTSGLLLLLAFTMPMLVGMSSAGGFDAMLATLLLITLVEMILGIAMTVAMIPVYILSHWTLAWSWKNVVFLTIATFILYGICNALGAIWLLAVLYLAISVYALRKLKQRFVGLKAPKLSKPGEGSLEEEAKAVG